ncbi:hypothetical protein V5P93_001688 [Actinokineospora auranticolor]|uniref:Peptidase inhibitor family I36 n=1 Tax=Actinokineospora auranticolor TaxID=155976 RepID=A0A2S6GGG8_9PSEU|nr:hypothetical protein [Actinokineospora auranticolor]PPK64291.1 hypothetical protein CLV40_12012 [Actinokineospora auranticolor]
MVTGKVLGALTGATIAVVGLTPTASAEVAAAAACQHTSGGGTTVSRAPVPGYGEIQLCRDGDYRYWGFLVLNNPPSVSQYGQAYLRRYRNSVPYPDTDFTCDSAGGNGKILPVPPQTRCWTPKLDGAAGVYTFEAEGRVYSSHTGTVLSRGYTARTR